MLGIAALWVIVGLGLLIAGGELLVRGASALAAAARVSPLVIGLTVVAFGTSSPELAVSIQSTVAGQGTIALGNVLGSNIANVLLIIGLSATIVPLVVSSRIVRWDVPLMIAASVATGAMSLNGGISRVEGGCLFGALVIYIVWTIVSSRRESRDVQLEFAEAAPDVPRGGRAIAWQLLLMIVGLAMLVGGADRLVVGAVAIARYFEVNELVIGLTIVAIGTSMPEVVTSVLASMRGERDIAVGNAVGSNLFNLLCVLGIASMVAPDGMEVPVSARNFDFPVMIAVAIACLPVFFTGHQISRWEGVLFLGYYLAYTAFLIIAATDPQLSKTFSAVMLYFALPLTAVTLAIGVRRQFRSQKDSQ